MAASGLPEPIAASDGLTATALLDSLERAFHAGKSEWLFLRELRVGTGVHRQAAQRLDAFALNCLPHHGMKRICYELKISRSDFLAELKHPLKRRIGMRYSNEFYFVTPAGMLKHSEIPVECGLIEVGQAAERDWSGSISGQSGFLHVDPETGRYCLIAVPASWRDTPGPTWQFTAAMLRNQRRELEERPPAPLRQQKLGLC